MKTHVKLRKKRVMANSTLSEFSERQTYSIRCWLNNFICLFLNIDCIVQFFRLIFFSFNEINILNTNTNNSQLYTLDILLFIIISGANNFIFNVLFLKISLTFINTIYVEGNKMAKIYLFTMPREQSAILFENIDLSLA